MNVASRSIALVCLAGLCLAMTAFAQTPAESPKPGRMEGVVVNPEGQPLARAQVRLQSPTRVDRGQAVQGASYAANTGDDGKFVFENIEPTRNLNLTAQRTGYVNARYGVRSLTSPPVVLEVKAGESLTGLILTMTPQAVISGRVIDPAGDPVQGIQVMLQRRGYQRGVRQMITVNQFQTNDQGEFRIPNLMPGRYYLFTRDSRGVDYGNGNIAIPTFFPSGTDERSATPIDLTAGQELRGLEVRMRQARGFNVRGKVVDPSGAPAPSVIFLPRRAGETTYNQSPQSRADGTFELRGLLAGAYVVEAVTTQNGTRTVGQFNVNVSEANVADLVFTITPALGGGKLNGTMRLEDGDLEELVPKPDPNLAQNAAQLAMSAANAGVAVSGLRPTVGLTSVNPTVSGALPAQLKPDGTFVFENLAPGKYMLNMAAVPPGTYMKSVKFGSVDALKAGIDYSSGGSLDIVLAKNPASVTGTVLNEKGEPQAGVMLTLWSPDPQPGSATNGVRTASTDRKGAFEFPGLPPDTYHVVAWEDIDSGLAQAREFLELVKADAVKVEPTAGENRTVELKMIPVAKIQAAEEKIP